MNELPQGYSLSTPRARKPHTCVECHGTIAPGEPYHKHTGIWDGRPETHKVCLDCETLRMEVDELVSSPEERTGFGGLADSIFDGGDIRLMRRYAAVRARRGCPSLGWMERRISQHDNMES